MYSNAHWKQSGDWQKDSCTIKAVRKNPHIIGRKVHLAGNTEEEGNPPWGMNGLSPILGTTALGSKPGRWVCLAGLKTSETSRRAVRNLDSSCEGWANTCLHPKQGRGSRWKLPRTLAIFLWLPLCAPQSEPSSCSGHTCSVAQLHIKVRADRADGSVEL